MRIFLCFAAILFAVTLMVGCEKDSAVTPVKNYQIIKLAQIDSTGLNGPINPHKP